MARSVPEPLNLARRALVVGYGLSGRAATQWLLEQGTEVVVLDDDPARAAQAQADLGPAAPVRTALAPSEVAVLVQGVGLVVPSPGVPISHPAIGAAVGAGVTVASEVELAWRALAQKRAGARAGRRDVGGREVALAAVTGTNGKTTVTEMVAAMLAASGRPARAAGNVGYPLLRAVGEWEPGQGQVLVAEVSSFQLYYSDSFAPDASCWLNFSPDHLDWHPSLEHYRAAKARIWAHQRPGSTVVYNADDAVVAASAAYVPAGVARARFGSGERGSVEWLVGADRVEGPGRLVLKAAELPRAFPHDLANLAAAAALSLACGATAQGVRHAARHGTAPAHRVQLVAQGGGVCWYDDSKATTPASVLAALAGLSSVVLVAGGRNKGLDLGVLAQGAPPVHAVVAIGEAAREVVTAFSGLVPVEVASSMAHAVQLAAATARPGDAVLFSPGCASFDWYSSYAQRGDHFSELARAQAARQPSPAVTAEHRGPTGPGHRGAQA